MDALDICIGIVEAEQIVYNELMEWLKQERHTSKRCAVKCFALLVAYRFFNDLDYEFCILWSEVELRSFQICEKPIDSLFQLLARDLSSALNHFAVFKDDRPVLAFNLFQWLSELLQVRLASLRQERCCL